MSAVFLLGWVVAVVLLLIGLYALVSPHAVARGYGVHADGHDAHGYVRATGIRDIALGVLLGAVAYFHSLPLLIVFAAVGIVVSIADLTIVWHHAHERRVHVAHGIHASGIVAFVLIIAMALFAIGR
jgi:hypothetical protein